MKKFFATCWTVAILFGACTLCSLPARADIQAEERVSNEVQILTRAAPVAADFETLGLSLNNINGYRMMVCAAASQTLSGAGSLQAYVRDDRTGMVSRNPGRDLAISVTATSCSGAACRCQHWDDVPTAYRFNKVIFATSGVTVSGGTTVTVYYFGYKQLR